MKGNIMNFKNLINKIGLFSLPVLGGLLGALGGADKSSKSYRRFVLPALLTSFAYSNTESLLVISVMSMSGALSLGYGIPGVGYPENTTVDSGSAIGRFFYKLFKKNLLLANIFTRATIGLLIAISFISLPIIKHNWIIYSACSLGIILTNGLISFRNFGSYKLFGKELSWVETINWGLITLFGTLIIYLK
jgi:hypothetical protein